MRRAVFLVVLMTILLAMPTLLTTSGSLTPSLESLDSTDSGGVLADSSPYSGKGAALDVLVQGTYTSGGSLWTMVGTTYAEDLTEGSSFVVNNATTVTWTVYASVSPPSGVDDVNLTVYYPQTEWKPTSVISPIGSVKTYPTEYTFTAGILAIPSATVDTYGLWKIEFIGWNHLYDLQLGVNGGSLSTTATFTDLQSMHFVPTSSFITGAVNEIELRDPTGAVWYSTSSTTVGSTTHVIPSFQYKKDITIKNGAVFDDFIDFPVALTILDTDLFNTSKVQADGDDILFVQNGYIIPHEIEDWQQNFDGSRARLVAWIRANLSNSVDTVISMYYGNPVVGPQQNPEAVWTSNYQAVWHLNDVATIGGTGATHYDSTAGSYDGIQSGNGRSGNARIGWSQYFDGVDDWITIPASEGLNPTGSLTISGWFRLPAAHSSTSTETQVIMTKYLSGDDDMHIALAGTDYNRAPVSDGSLVFKIETVSGSATYVYSSTTSWAANTWYYFSCYMDSSTPGNSMIYINGVQDYGGFDLIGSYADLAYDGQWGIGGRYTDSQIPGSEGYFYGYIDEVQITSGARSAGWRTTEYYNQNNPTNTVFRTIGSESSRPTSEPSFVKALDSSAPAGLWSVSMQYRDATSPTYQVGKYERNFIVQHSTSLSLISPGDAIGDGISARIAGDLLYIEVSLTDTISSSLVNGATVTTNWTAYGSPTVAPLEDYGDGHYGVALNTTDLGTAKSWRIEIDSSHPYYLDSSTFFDLNLYHDTELIYDSVSTTPVGFDFTASLYYYDTYTGLPITGATITLGDGSPVTIDWEGGGQYNVSLSTLGLSRGNYAYAFNASKPGSYMSMASVTITFTLRAHYTAVAIQGDLTVPWGDTTTVTATLIDLDTGLAIPAANIQSWTFDWGEDSRTENTPADLVYILPTDSWSVGFDTVTLSVNMANSNYYAPDDYDFQITIRAHYTSVSVTGVLTEPYGNMTDVTVVITDLDTGSLVGIGSVGVLDFSSGAWSQIENNPGTSQILLDTTGWSVGTRQVTLDVTMLGTNYVDPNTYNFNIVIRNLQTSLYNEPSDLIFPNGDDFIIVLSLNVSEPESVFYGAPVNGLTGSHFTVTSGATTYVKTITPLGNGRYQLTISAAYFTEGDYTIVVVADSAADNYALAVHVITFRYQPAESLLSSPNYPQVITPYQTDVTITLTYWDIDRELGIDGATITSNISISTTPLGSGQYQVTLHVTGLSQGTHPFYITADKSGYTAKTLEFTLTIRIAYTYAIPSVGALSIPVGADPVFYVKYWDTDHDVSITGASVQVTGWTHAPAVTYDAGLQRYRIEFITEETDLLQENTIVTFNFTVGANYQPGVFTISVTVRTHNADFRLVSAVPPTTYTGTIEVPVYYGDLDGALGITNSSGYILVTVTSLSVPFPFFTVVETGTGDGYYTVSIPASQFTLGLKTLNITFSWTGPVQVYQNKWLTATVNIVGEDSKLTLMLASDPTAYLGIMSYTFFYSDLADIGITNTSSNPYGAGHVHISVLFQGITVDLGQVTIEEVTGQLGNFSISFNTTIFGATGLFYMNVYIDWETGVAPYYTNRFDVISVSVLTRDTLLLIDPPSPQYWGEMASFTFGYQDVTGAGSVPIEDDIALSVTTTLSEYTVTYLSGTQRFQITFNTSQYASLGQKSFLLNVVWYGEPFYANRTGRTIYITVLARLAVLDYQSPAQTPYLDNVTFLLTWTDVTSISTGISTATLTLYYGAFAVDTDYYSWALTGPGQYQVELDTTYFGSPGTYPLRVLMQTAEFYIEDDTDTRNLVVRYRPVLLSAEKTDKLPYGLPMEFVINYLDADTLLPISSGTTFEILNVSTWDFTFVWNAVLGHYDLTVETDNHPEFAINTPYSLYVRVTYSGSSYYETKTAYITFEFRSRESQLVLEDPADPTAYLDYTNFTVFYRDIDAEPFVGIPAEDIEVYLGATPLAYPTQYIFASLAQGRYLISVNTTALGLGPYSLRIVATWNPSSAPYHDNAEVNVAVSVVGRETSVEITQTPLQTQYLDNVVLVFTFVDLLRSSPIPGLTTNEVEVWGNGVLLNTADYTLTDLSGSFRLTVNSSVLAATAPISSYNLTIRVDWNNIIAPYYYDSAREVRVTITRRFMTYSPDPIEAVNYGENVSIQFTLEDSDRGWPVAGALIAFDGQTVVLVEGVDFDIIYGTGVDEGLYTIVLKTTSLPNPGTFYFDLTITWNPLDSPFYRSLGTIGISARILDIETRIEVASDYLIMLWHQDVSMIAFYVSVLDSSYIPDATMTWTVSGGGQGNFTDVASDGNYTAIITTLADVGTYTITIRATKMNYLVAQTYVTLVVQAVPSFITINEPSEKFIELPKGSPIQIAIELTDSTAQPIAVQYVNSVIANLEGVNYPLVYNTTSGFWEVLLPGSATLVLSVDISYRVRITANLRNYEPVADSFNIIISESRSELTLLMPSTSEPVAVYTQLVNFTVYFEAPDRSLNLSGGQVKWYIAERGLNGTFLDRGNGVYSILINTVDIGYGIWGISIRGVPDQDDIASTALQVILTINRIQTTAYTTETPDLYWGWAGNITFVYWDEFFRQGVSGASANYTLPGLPATAAMDPWGNGTYVVFLNTSLLLPSDVRIPLTITFQKPNYQEASDTLLIRIREVPTDIVLTIPEVNVDPDNPSRYQVPYGDSVTITVFYNDTDFSDGYVGGLVGANISLSSIFGPTRELTNFELIPLGDGYYYFIFDTLDPWLFEQVIGEPGPQTSPYRLTIRLALANRTAAFIEVFMSIIELPTAIEIIEMSTDLFYGDSGRLVVMYIDDWPGHSAGTLITGANFTVDVGLSVTQLLEIGNPYEDPTRPGYYIIDYTAAGPIIGDTLGTSDIILYLSVENVEVQEIDLRVVVRPTEAARVLTQAVSWGTPIALFVIIGLVAYIKVWSVPKRLRQINGQIKELRKGKIPKPITEAKTRQQLLAGLFNDTFAPLDIKRKPEQMPIDSVPIDVPEMGELLIQLAILTNLNADELDEFKADIAKMRISEQAAFVKEVIMQEALRAARREGKTVDEIMENLQAEANRKLGEGEEDAIPSREEAVEEESVILRRGEVKEEAPPGKKVPSEDVSFTSDYLSAYEIEELQSELIRRGVPSHEIDTILEQAKKLPRDLVEELIRSVGKDKE
ncbi:MAG: hypothetical protein EAX95_06740 [Candidatus Thorarchaeota archaeon]|nr:hypothetical protein [Candidatus Thorarchaeota archaeon]